MTNKNPLNLAPSTLALVNSYTDSSNILKKCEFESIDELTSDALMCGISGKDDGKVIFSLVALIHAFLVKESEKDDEQTFAE